MKPLHSFLKYYMKNLKKLFEWNAPPSLPPSPPTPLMGLSYGEQSLCRVPPSPVHLHKGAPMHSCFFIFVANSLIFYLVGAFLLLSWVYVSQSVASFWCHIGAVILHVSCPNSASRLSSCYSWYLLTWNCVQLEFSDNDRFNTTVLVSPSPMTRRPYVLSSTSPRPRVPVSPSPTSRRPQALASQVPHPRPTFSHSPKSELG